MTDHYRSLDDWYSLILECRGSGMTDAEWCRINGISRDAFYSALKRLRKKPVEIPPSSRGVIVHDLTKPSAQDVVKVPTISDP